MIAIADRSFVPQRGDIHIQNPRPPLGAACIDPQHGGHRRPDPSGWLLDPHRPVPAETLAVLATLTDEAVRRAYQRAWVDSCNGCGPQGTPCGDGSQFDPLAVAEWAKAHPMHELEKGEWPEPLPGDAACTFALRVRGMIPPDARIVLPFNASLDSWVAAAALTLDGAAVSDEAVRRVAALAAADGVEHHAALGEWCPGYTLPTVGDDARFSGLARLVATRVAPTTKLAALREWLTRGSLLSGPFSGSDLDGLMAAGVTPEDCTMCPADLLPRLSALALCERNESLAACEVTLLGPGGAPVDLTYAEIQAQQQLPAGVSVALVISQMSGLSAGRGAFVVGYRYAPVVVCCSPAGDPRQPAGMRGPLFTVGRAANARSVVFPFAALCAALNDAEIGARLAADSSVDVAGLRPGPDGRAQAGWGGNPTSGVLGSPKPLGGWQGSILDPLDVARIVERVCAAASQ